MNLRHRFGVALGASAILHLAVLLWPLGPRFVLDDGGPAPPLTAHLAEPAVVATPRPAVAPVRPARAFKPRLRPVPAPAIDMAAAELPVTIPPPEPEPPPEPPAEAPPEPPAPAEDAAAAPSVAETVPSAAEPAGESLPMVDLPTAVRIRYKVTMGENGFVLGKMLQEFHQDGARYAMRSTAATTGLANLFKPASVVNSSEGEIVKGRLRPRQYRAERGKGKIDSVRFNWEESRLALADGREFELQGETQDMLSVFFQLALMVPTDLPVISLPVTTGRKLERYEFEVIGEKIIDTPIGARRTLHLRASRPEGRDSTEVWLSLEDSRLPVKIRHVDRKGDVFEQVAERIDMGLSQERAP